MYAHTAKGKELCKRRGERKMTKIPIGLTLLYIASFYIAYKIFQPELIEAWKRLILLKKLSHRKTKRYNTNKKI